MRMILGLSDALPKLVEAKFKSAKASSSLVFSATELTTIRTVSGVTCQLRYCPALAKKPEANKEGNDSTKKPDPFDNPPAELLIAEIPAAHPTHVLVLNKFPIIEEHFILATKANKEQTHGLEKDDLDAAYTCLSAWEDSEARGRPNRLFAFFNSGEHSGASQPHRHLQFLPIEKMQDGESNDWDPLTDLILSSPVTVKGSPLNLTSNPCLPFIHFACPFPQEPTGDELLQIYNILYQRAHKSVDEYIATHPDELSFHDASTGSLPISYNLAMTTEGMAILPRRRGGASLRRDDGSEVGFVELNGTALAGTLMVKYQEQWELLQKKPRTLDSILEAIAIPKNPGVLRLSAEVEANSEETVGKQSGASL